LPSTDDPGSHLAVAELFEVLSANSPGFAEPPVEALQVGMAVEEAAKAGMAFF
jgi:hypothetical protein